MTLSLLPYNNVRIIIRSEVTVSFFVPKSTRSHFIRIKLDPLTRMFSLIVTNEKKMTNMEDDTLFEGVLAYPVKGSL